MKVKVCFEVKCIDENGDSSLFGLAMIIGESASPVDYGKLTRSINKEAVLRVCGLDDLVKPEDMTVITPEEFSLKYGDDEED